MLSAWLPVVGFGVGSLAFACLGALVAGGPRRDTVHLALVAGTAVSALWLGLTAAIRADAISFPLTGLTALEVLRSLVWASIPCLYAAAGKRMLGAGKTRDIGRTVIVYLTAALVLSLCAWSGLLFGPRLGLPGFSFVSLLGLSVTGLAGVELLYRNTHPDDRWAIKYFCLGVGVMFAYDVYLYAEAALFGSYSADAWLARGAVNALAVPPLLIAVRRDPERPLRVFVSRHVVFHGASLIVVGAYLMLLAVAAFYVNTRGGSWGGTLRIVLVAAGLMGLIVVMLSGEARAQLRQFLIRHFYQNKYDYAEQWLKFTERLANPGEDLSQVAESVLRAVLQPVESTGGILYEVRQRSQLEALARIEFNNPELQHLRLPQVLRQKLSEEQVVAVADISGASSAVPALAGNPRAWALVPVVHDSDLLAVILLAVPRVNAKPGREDCDLLLTLGKQAAALLALVKANQRLAESRQFDAFSRLSAFVVHDVKNVVAQLELINRNAKKHRDNPEFVEDAFNTVESAVERMNRLLDGLRKASNPATERSVFSVNQLVEAACAHCDGRVPKPTYHAASQSIRMEGDAESLQHALEHLITNAQEATPAHGVVQVSVRVVQEGREGADDNSAGAPAPEIPSDYVVVSIEDSGRGMSREFINTRLFAPFVTTKGNSGMGLGVFEARHVVESLGGTIEVHSVLGQGSKFDIFLPAETVD